MGVLCAHAVEEGPRIWIVRRVVAVQGLAAAPKFHYALARCTRNPMRQSLAKQQQAPASHAIFHDVSHGVCASLYVTAHHLKLAGCSGRSFCACVGGAGADVSAGCLTLAELGASSFLGGGKGELLSGA